MREIWSLNCELGAALDLVAKLEFKLDALKVQRDVQEGSSNIWQIYKRDRSVYRARFEGLRGGAGDDDYDDEFRVRHPECSSDNAASATPELFELDKEIKRLHLLMAKAQKRPEGDQSNWDILAQLQRMIDQLEAERDTARNLNVSSNAHDGQGETGLRGGAGEKEDVETLEKWALSCDLDGYSTPPLPPRNPARKERKRLSVVSLEEPSSSRLDEHTELNEAIDLITFVDKTRAWIEPLILAHIASPEVDRSNVPHQTVALIIKLDRLLELRQELWRQAKLLAFPDDATMEVVRGLATIATTSVNAFRSYKTRPHTMEAGLRGGGSTQSTVEKEGEIERAVPDYFSDAPAPPVPARNPARVRGGPSTPAYDNDLERKIATLERDIARASQQFQARASQVAPSSYLVNLEADNIERLVTKLQDFHRRRARIIPSQPAPPTRRDSGTGTDAEAQAARSAIWRGMTAIVHAAGAWASRDDDISAPAPEPQLPEPLVSSPAAPTHPPYRVLSCQDWTWPHPNWHFDNLSPSQKVSLLRERSSWLARQRDIHEEQRAIDIEIVRLRSLIGQEHDPATYRNPVSPGYDGLGNPINTYLARWRYNRTSPLS
ncbi:hypothetical protein E8E11_011727 [Didymella keratinophila]|nr:hypothetical protein E8E11_011727 [Didymella keratinophila]